MSSYETLRYSLDNILKELDDICRSIDDLTDIEPNNNSNIDDIEYYQKIIKNPSIHLSSVGLASINKSIGLKKHSIANQSEPFSIRSKQSDEIYYTAEDDDVYNRYNLRDFRQSKSFQTNNFYMDDSKNIGELSLEDQNVKISSDEEKKSKKKQFLKPITDRIFNSNSTPFKKHRLPSADSKDLNTVIGSVRDSFLFKNLSPLPLETESQIYDENNNNNVDEYDGDENRNQNNNDDYDESNDYDDTINQFDASRVRASPHLKRNSKLISSLNVNQVDSLTTNESFEYGDDEQAQYNESNDYYKTIPNRGINEDADYLNPSEISKIECFYNSMGCYVYVGKCIAELYQIKREDEFDAIDNDPVNDYKIYMENLNNKQSLTNLSKSKVNYTYINSGVPVIIFNYGANPKRDKDLRILLVERSTGFCMWEFKFDWLTQLDLSYRMSAVRLTLNNNAAYLNNNIESSATSQSNNSNQNGSLFSNKASSINYQNEYFEKFFNSKNRHAHKEHLLKFVIKRDCDEFSFVLSRIMSDKRNSDMFVMKKEIYHFNPDDINCFPPPLTSSHTSSSVIICHFDSLNNDSNKLNDNQNQDSSQSSLADSNNIDIENSLKPSIKSNLSRKSVLLNDINKFDNYEVAKSLAVEFDTESNIVKEDERSNETNNKCDLNREVKFRKLRKSDISSPLSFNHVSHLDKPVAIGKRYKFNYS